MASDFFYFTSTLPALSLPGAPQESISGPTWKEFMEQCRLLLGPSEAKVIASLQLCPPADYVSDPEKIGASLPSVARKWYDWQIAMRNALGRRRAARLGGRAMSARPEQEVFPNDLKKLDTVFEAPTAIGRAWAWLLVEWSRLQELSACEQFNLNAVAVYALQIRLLDEARRYDCKNGAVLFRNMVDRIVSSAQECRH